MKHWVACIWLVHECMPLHVCMFVCIFFTYAWGICTSCTTTAVWMLVGWWRISRDTAEINCWSGECEWVGNSLAELYRESLRQTDCLVSPTFWCRQREMNVTACGHRDHHCWFHLWHFIHSVINPGTFSLVVLFHNCTLTHTHKHSQTCTDTHTYRGKEHSHCMDPLLIHP